VLLIGHTRRAPLAEIRYSGLPLVKASMEMTVEHMYETHHPAYKPVIICNRKQGHYNDHKICEIMTLNEIHYNPATSTYL
jgi:hypothetical protein